MSQVLTSGEALAEGSDPGEEALIISRCVSGEEEAFITVYKMYAAVIYRLCFSLLQHREDSEEVLQDTFEYAFRKIKNYDANKAKFKTWLYQIAISRCRNKRRRKWLKTLPMTDNIEESLIDKNSPSPSALADLNERQKMVWSAMGELSLKLRESIYLRYYEGLTYSEIGVILKIPAKTAESRVRLGHKALQKFLAEESD